MSVSLTDGKSCGEKYTLLRQYICGQLFFLITVLMGDCSHKMARGAMEEWENTDIIHGD